MKLPNINIVFTTRATSAITRSEKGTIALIIRDTNNGGIHILTSFAQIPQGLDERNREYISRAFIGYVNPPKKIILYVLTNDDISEALEQLEIQSFDYLAGPLDITIEECEQIVSWIKKQRADGFMPKAVLPNTAADNEAIINFTTDNIKSASKEYTAAEYCSRIAGLIAGTPMTISCTYAQLPEVSDISRLSKDEMDDAVGKGELIIFHDGEKVKVGRGVNSLQTTTSEKGEVFKKIKIVEAIDMIKKDIKETIEDAYIGRYPNSYDNKCLLISAIKGYFTGLENAGILERGTSNVEIDIDAQDAYLQSIGKDTSKMSEQEIKTAPTGDKVFLKANITILDAIEDVDLSITI